MVRLSNILSDKGITRPVGTIESTTDTSVPTGWLLCDGMSLDATVNTQYQRLYEVMGNIYGGVDNTDFQLPDLRGEFVRGADSGRGIDIGRSFGTSQPAKMIIHDHLIGDLSGNSSNAPHSHPASSSSSSNAPHSHTGTAGGTPSLWWSIQSGPTLSNIAPTTASTATTVNAPHAHSTVVALPVAPAPHIHAVTGETGLQDASPGNSNNNEVRPTNLAINYIIKL